MGECLVGAENCFSCVKGVHKVRYCPTIKAKGKESNQGQTSSPNFDDPKKNRFYNLHSRGEENDSPKICHWYVPSVLY